ncbi:MAG: hypothetical protein RLP15_11220 [Cryomorphaceae bacterium]
MSKEVQVVNFDLNRCGTVLLDQLFFRVRTSGASGAMLEDPHWMVI